MKEPRKKSPIDTVMLDVDDTGFVRVAFNKVDVKDHDGDVIVPEAYTKTLSESKGSIYHLSDHTWKWSNFIAKPTNIYLKNQYLIGESEIDIKTNPWGAYMHARYLKGDVEQHSIGFYIIKQQKKSDYNEITELHLLEGSAVLWGANPDTPTLDAKSLERKGVEILTDIQEVHTEMVKYLKTGLTPEDTIFMGRRLEQLHTEAKSLFTKPLESTLPKQKAVTAEELKSIINEFNF